ncbi:ubiquitin-specific protease ubp15 [Linderina macrospora]|uniref:Ubiquitin-specific protease ubp15 n=1 Tax=Linderina macrospora TaxID=4868 RepID=A0ACC1JB20_9FUNG|nr:ubiquitin-specific protease ubp15 [Linderina macrospora]
MSDPQEEDSNALPPYSAPPDQLLSAEDSRLLDKFAPLPGGFDEEAHGVFHWIIDDWSEKLKQSQEKSTVFSQELTLAGCQWQLYLYPQSTLYPAYVGMRLRCLTTDVVPNDWEKCLVFGLVIDNINNRISYENATSRFRVSHKIPASVYDKFTIRKSLSERQTYNDKPVIEDDKLRISIYMRTVLDETGVLWDYFKKGYDSYKQTGYAGLLPQERYLPLAPLLQTLYNIKPLRAAIDSARSAGNEPDKLLVLALRELFAGMKSSSRPMSTQKVEAVIRLLGPHGLHSAPNNQIYEFTSTIMDSLVKGLTKATHSNHVELLLGGLKRTTIKRVGVDPKQLSFFQRLNYSDKTVVDSPVNPLRLNIKGFHSVTEALREHFSLRVLTGADRPRTKGIVPYDATEKIHLLQLPSVLFIHLDRFEVAGSPAKVTKSDTSIEFDEVLDMSEVASDSDIHSSSSRYTLYGVMVHRGDGDKGNHFCILRPTIDDKWFLFEDEIVVPVRREEVFDKYETKDLQCSFGEASRQKEIVAAKRFANAYMLVYVRDDKTSKIIGV